MIQTERLAFISAVFIFLLTIPANQVGIATTNQDNLDNNSNHSDAISGTNLTSPIVEGSKLNIVASFYPIYEFVNQVGSDKVTVTSLIPVGIEPHDFEPTIQQIQETESADAVLFNGLGFESSFLDRMSNDNLLDTSVGVNISNTMDPHIWLDPILAKTQVKNIEEALVKLDPVNKDYYHNNAANFSRTLDILDAQIRSILQTCDKRDFITSHDAFGHFADRYGLNQHSIQGIAPDGQILPQKIQETVELARDKGISVIYSEEFVDPRFAEVIAQEIEGAEVLTLSPIEGIKTEEQADGIDYIDKMSENLANLKIGLGCQD
jgi:zinc transport system substrate-binding protein